MANKPLSEALHRLDALQSPNETDPRQLIWRILENDRRRVRRWTVLSVGLWLLAAVLIAAALLLFGFFMPAHAHAMRDAGIEFPQAGMQPTPAQLHLILTAFLGKLSLLVTAGVMALVLASMTSFFLLNVTRRATLRQVNASLLEISEQLKRLPA